MYTSLLKISKKKTNNQMKKTGKKYGQPGCRRKYRQKHTQPQYYLGQQSSSGPQNHFRKKKKIISGKRLDQSYFYHNLMLFALFSMLTCVLTVHNSGGKKPREPQHISWHWYQSYRSNRILHHHALGVKKMKP